MKFSNDENLIINKGNRTIDGMFDKSEDSFHYIVSRKDLNINLFGRFIIKTSSKVIVLDNIIKNYLHLFLNYLE